MFLFPTLLIILVPLGVIFRPCKGPDPWIVTTGLQCVKQIVLANQLILFMHLMTQGSELSHHQRL